VTLEGVIKNSALRHSCVIGKERFCEGRWIFRIDQVGWVMFGVLSVIYIDLSSSNTWSFNWPGNYGVSTSMTYANGLARNACMPFQSGDLVAVELKAGTLSVCNLRSGQVARVDVPTGEYRLHLNLHAAQVTWQG